MPRMAAEVTLFRQTAERWPGGPKVHILEKRIGFMLCTPSVCHTVLAEVLAEKVTVPRDALLAHTPAELVNRGYCRHCIGTLG